MDRRKGPYVDDGSVPRVLLWLLDTEQVWYTGQGPYTECTFFPRYLCIIYLRDPLWGQVVTLSVQALSHKESLLLLWTSNVRSVCDSLKVRSTVK